MIKTSQIIEKLTTEDQKYNYYSIAKLNKLTNTDFNQLPFTLKILLENILRNAEKTPTIKIETYIKYFQTWLKNKQVKAEINYYPTRILMQDFTGVPSLVDLATMRDVVKSAGKNPSIINPSIPVDLIIDHSIQVDHYGNNSSLDKNTNIEIKRNYERYKFLKWGQQSFNNLRVIPPGKGICHQINLEYLAQVICNNNGIIYPDTLIGTDSHTTMINAISVLGWGVGGIEAEAAMLGYPITMPIPEVIGVKLTGNLQDGITATDLILTITETLRKQKETVGKFIEFYGDGLTNLSLADRATIANMAPEYGATCGFFPIDEQTLKYLKLTNKEAKQIQIIKQYAKKQFLWNTSNNIIYSETLEIKLNNIEPSVAGPKRPQDRLALKDIPKSTNITQYNNKKLSNNSVVIAAITSCTNTSNPNVMIGAGLVAKKAVDLGLKVKPWVKTSLAPGSTVVAQYLINSDLQKYFDALGFHIVGYGCTTCIGNSGPLKTEIEEEIKKQNLTVASVLSGNRNFEGRIHPLSKLNYLASPPLVIIYALAGSVSINLAKDPIGLDRNNKPVFLKDLWPNNTQIEDTINKHITPKIFADKYNTIFQGNNEWNNIQISNDKTYDWDAANTYIQKPDYCKINNYQKYSDIKNARILCLFGDSITTDHISPAGSIPDDSEAANYLKSLNIKKESFNSYGSRRGNHNIMIRGTFANIRISNKIVNKNGGYTIFFPENKITSVFNAATLYAKNKTPLVVVAGKEYGAGSSRDWAAKGTYLLGVKAILAESFERIHRSNLVGMGVLPLEFTKEYNSSNINITGKEIINIFDLETIYPNKIVNCEAIANNKITKFTAICKINTQNEVEYLKNKGILNNVLSKLV